MKRVIEHSFAVPLFNHFPSDEIAKHYEKKQADFDYENFTSNQEKGLPYRVSFASLGVDHGHEYQPLFLIIINYYSVNVLTDQEQKKIIRRHKRFLSGYVDNLTLTPLPMDIVNDFLSADFSGGNYGELTPVGLH